MTEVLCFLSFFASREYKGIVVNEIWGWILEENLGFRLEDYMRGLAM